MRMRSLGYLVGLLSLSLLHAVEVDVDTLKKIVAKNPKDVENRIVLASYYLDHGKYRAAEHYLRDVLRIDPKNELAQKLYQTAREMRFYQRMLETYGSDEKAATALLEQNETEKLLLFFEAWNTLPPGERGMLEDQTLLRIARVAMHENRNDIAIEALKNVRNNDNLTYYRLLARAYENLNELDKAARYYEIIYEKSGDTEDAKHLLALYQKTGNMAAQGRLIDELRLKDPEIARQYAEQMRKKQQEQLKKLQEAYESDPSFQTLKPYAEALYPVDHQKAIATVRTYVREHPHDQDAILYLTDLLTWNGDNAKALAVIEEYGDIDDPAVKLKYAKLLAWNGRYDEALAILRDVQTNGTEKERLDAMKMTAFVLMWKGDKQAAIEAFHAYLDRMPDDQNAKEALDTLEGNLSPYIAEYKKRLKADPDNPVYLHKLAEYSFRSHRYRDAVTYYRRYLKIRPNDWDAYKAYGEALLKIGRKREGFAALERYAEGEGTPEARLDLAKEYYWQGDYRRAERIVDDLLKANPSFKEAKRLKQQIRDRLSRRYATRTKASTPSRSNSPASYYDRRAAELLRFADRAYFAGFYNNALGYYKEYLDLKPNDNDARERYAYSLEYTKHYAKAAGEFYLLTWHKKDPLTLYHYALNLQRSGEPEKARIVYKKLLKEVPKPLPVPLKRFLINWKRALESLDFHRFARYYGRNYVADRRWKEKMRRIFNESAYIDVGIYSPVLLKRQYDYYTIKFFETYDRDGAVSEGYVTMVLRCDYDYGEGCRIVKESFKPGHYITHDPDTELYRLILQRLQEIDKGEALPPPPQTAERQSTTLQRQRYTEPREAAETARTYRYEPKSRDLPLRRTASMTPPSGKEKVTSKTRTRGVETGKEKRAYPDELARRNDKGWTLDGHLDIFGDNAGIDMTSTRIQASKQFINGFTGYSFLRNYWLRQDGLKRDGFDLGVGLEKGNYAFDIFLDNSGPTADMGGNFRYTNFLADGLTLLLNRENLVHTRRTICSANETKNRIELTGYRGLGPYREFWWSGAYEYISDGNSVFIPQFAYDITAFNTDSIPIVPYLAGWYMFNSQTTDCYYSPSITDTNLLGAKVHIDLGHQLYSRIHGALGYSFNDQVSLYDLGFRVYSDPMSDLHGSLGCSFSNSSNYSNLYTGYRSYECSFDLRKMW